ncbi:MAG: hypothetical protein LBM19_02930 [Holosporales bacterium]|nr:hypothetical protein [Holosporales bacterium]
MIALLITVLISVRESPLLAAENSAGDTIPRHPLLADGVRYGGVITYAQYKERRRMAEITRLREKVREGNMAFQRLFNEFGIFDLDS